MSKLIGENTPWPSKWSRLEMALPQKFSRIGFTVRSIECVACTPVFKRELDRTRGVKSVRALVMLNRIEVEFDESVISRNTIEEKIRDIGSKAGFGGKILFSD